MSIRDRVTGAAAIVANALPPRIADRVLPGRRREFREAGFTPVPDGNVRLWIGPANSAGQGFAWARAAETLPGVGASSVVLAEVNAVFGFPVDHSVPTTPYVRNERWQRVQARSVAQGFTHALIESGRAPFGTASPLSAQLALLADNGVGTALLWHGSDIRLPSRHAQIEADSPFIGDAYPDTALLEDLTAANARLAYESGLPSFVSTPDLLAFLPGATWLPVVIEPQRWASAALTPALERRRPIVVHAPSRSALKGSSLIQGIVRDLDADGVIEYREAHGIPSAEMPRFYGDADVVLDQFSLGIYGVATCEAMAAGRLVVSHVGSGVRDAVRERTGFDLPVVEATAADLDRVLRDIAANPERFRPMLQRGPEFVAAVHDGRLSARALAPFLGVDVDA